MKKTFGLGLAALTFAVASCGGDITVSARVVSVSVTPSTSTVIVNSTTQLTAIAVDDQGVVLSGVPIAWASSTTAIAGVTTTGFVTGVSVGTAVITATAGGHTGSATISVVPPSYAITATASPPNGGTVTGAGNLQGGSTATLVATPATGYQFTNWTEGGTAVSTSTTLSFAVTGARSLVANFSLLPTYALSLAGAGTGSGTITAPATGGQAALSCTITAGVASGTCTGTYPSGTSVTLTEAPATNNTFTTWGGACAGSSTTCVVAVTQARSVSATFTPVDLCPPVALSFPATLNGTVTVNGSVSSSGCVINGQAGAVYRFTTTGNFGAAFSVTSTAFAAALEVSTDPVGSNVSWVNSTGPTVSGEWLLPSGSFLVRVRATTGGSGAFSLTGTATIGSGGCTIRTLVTSVNLSGQTLASNDCTTNSVTFLAPGLYFADYFYIRTLKACTITMSPAGFAGWLDVWDATTGARLFSSGGTGPGTTNAQVSVSPPACSNNGNAIVIVANSFAAGATGTYTLAVAVTGGGSVRADEKEQNLGEPELRVQDIAKILRILRPPR